MRRDNVIGFFITSILILFTLIVFDCRLTHAAGILVPKGNSYDNSITLQKHNVRVSIINGFAQTEVDQEFFNTSDQDLEAVYSFPLPQKASLSELSLFIDGKECIGEVLAKKEAKEVYDNQKNKGNNAAHAEQVEQKTFRISVSSVKAQHPIRIRLVYYQPLEIDLSVGRYVYPLAEGGTDEEQSSFWSIDDAVKEEFNFDLLLKSAVAIKDIRLPGYMQHAVISSKNNSTVDEKSEQNTLDRDLSENIDHSSTNSHVYEAHFSSKSGAHLDKDIVLYYRLEDSAPARVELVPYKEQGKDGFFMLSITPGAELAPISSGIDWTFVLDSSGSMSGEKIEGLQKGVAMALKKMRSQDRFRLIQFSEDAYDLSDGFLPANQTNIEKSLQLLESIVAYGKTNLHKGLSKAIDITDEERTTVIVLISDGVANIGKTAHSDFMSLIKKQDVRLFTFLMGNSGNRKLLKDLAEVSGGFSMEISSQDDLGGRILQAKTKALRQNMHNVRVNFSEKGVSQLIPSKISSIYEGEQIVLFGKYAKGGDVNLVMNAKISGEDKEWRCKLNLPVEDVNNPEIARLWALAKISELDKQARREGVKDKYKQEITDIGMQYSLVTEHTSMVVVEEKEKEQYGLGSANKERIEKEREAASKRAKESVKNYRVDRDDENSMFSGKSASNIGAGAVDPILMLIIILAVFPLLQTRAVRNENQ